jgi:hypothetical protein
MIEELGKTLKDLATGWTSYTAFGSFLLYVVGYLTLRFHLTALGVGTDLAVLDERYFFTGVRFAVYLVAALPVVVLLALILFAALYLPYRLLPETIRVHLWTWGRNLQQRPVTLTLIGIVLAVLMIQLVMRQCFFFSNLLLADHLPRQAPWLAQLLIGGAMMPVFFSALMAGTAITAAIFLAVCESAEQARHFKLLKGLLVVLVAIQILLLPVNYGVLIVDKSLPRVVSVGSDRVPEGQQAWLVWEGKEGVTYLLRKSDATRSLLTLPRGDVKRIEITGYDPIMAGLFRATPERKSNER